MIGGMPQLITSVDYDENDELLIKIFMSRELKCLQKRDVKTFIPRDSKQAPGLDIHEMGGVRMEKIQRHRCLINGTSFIIARMYL
jgi:hypothetical protein